MSFKFVDLFAGIGGMRIAFEKAGGECVLTCEIDKSALQTYKANFASSNNHIYHDNIETLESSLIPKHDVLLAGFPCQPYSVAGLRKGLEDERGSGIFSSILRIIKDKSPTAFLLENVKGILNHQKGKTFNYIISELNNCGYTLSYQVLNSMDYANIPQSRDRVFIVGFNDRKKFEKFDFPDKTSLTKTIADCLEKSKMPEEYYYDNRFACYSEIVKAVKDKGSIYQWRRKYVRENKSNVCPTLTANMGTGGHNVPIILDDFGIRKLTPRETANFQGFPKDFNIPNIANSKLYKQFGNSVTVPLISKLASQIVQVL